MLPKTGRRLHETALIIKKTFYFIAGSKAPLHVGPGLSNPRRHAHSTPMASLNVKLEIEQQENSAITAKAHFSVGDLVNHKLFSYRGVIFDVDPCFMLSDEWYETVARSRPPKNRPWYRVLVHDSTHETYVAERNLTADTSGEPVRNPLINTCFSSFHDGHYLTTERMN